MSVVKCGGMFHLLWGVRVSFKSVDGRTSVYVGLKADSEMMANATALTVWEWLVKACETPWLVSPSSLSKVQASPEVGSGQRF